MARPPEARTVKDALELGLAYQASGRRREAQWVFQQLLRASPGQPAALRSLGRLAFENGYIGAAIRLLRQASDAAPLAVELLVDLGDVCGSAGRGAEAAACYRQAVALKPDDAGIMRRLGHALLGAGRTTDAVEWLGQVARLQPARALSHFDLGNAVYLAGDLDEAIACLRVALKLDPDWADAHNNLGHVLKDLGQLDQAVEAFRRAHALAPGRAALHSNLLYTLWYHPGYTPAAIYEEHRRWGERHADPLQTRPAMYRNGRDPDRRLRVGYLSPHFRAHPLGLLAEPLLAAHDRRAVEVVCYADVSQPDGVTARIRRSSDVWRDTTRATDGQLQHLIRQDRIDVLVDLTLHMAGNRLPLFGRKPAPIQVTYLAYPATSGIRAMDYRITDYHLDPPGEGRDQRTERLVRLARSYWCYAPSEDSPDVGPLPAAGTGSVTFGSLNNFCKLNADVLRLWAEILDAVPKTRLAVLTTGRSASYGAMLAANGIAPDRAVLLERAPRDEYLRYFQALDVSLDPFPCSGHTTSLDSLWMGVPVVALAGRTAMGRATASQLACLGLGELIAGSPEEYARIATALARDTDRLRALRAGLRQRMQSSPLRDPDGLARQLEAAYRQMWVAWCQGRAGSDRDELPV